MPDRQRDIDARQIPGHDTGNATTATAAPCQFDHVSPTKHGIGNLADDSEARSWQRGSESDRRRIGTRIDVLRRRIQLTLRGLLSRDQDKPALDVGGARLLRHYLRQAIHDRVVQGMPPAVTMCPREVDRYRSACSRLRPDDRDQIVAIIELGYSYDQLALAMSRSAPQARSAAKEALLRLVEEMSRA